MTEAVTRLKHVRRTDDGRLSATLRTARQVEADARMSGDFDALVIAHCYQALAYRKQRDFARAQDVLEDAAEIAVGKIQPETMGALEVQLAWLDSDGGQFTAACLRYEGAAKTLDADQLAQAECFVAWASALRELGDYEGSRERLDLALALIGEQTEEWARIQDGFGQLSAAQGRYSESVDYLESAIDFLGHADLEAEQAACRVHLAAVHLKQGRFDRAERQAEMALSAGGADVSGVQQLLGEIALETGALHRARTILRSALKGFQRNTDDHGAGTACRLLAATYIRLGDLDRAEEYVDDADDALRRTDDTVERGLLSIVRAELAVARGQLRDGGEMLAAALRHFARPSLDQERLIAKRALASVALLRRDLDKVQALLDEVDGLVGENRPEESRVLTLRAELLEHRGDLHLAIDTFRRAGEVDLDLGWNVELARNQVHIGRVHRRLDEHDVARDALEQAVAIWADSGDVASRGWVAVELGDLALDQHSLEAAAEQYRTAIDFLREAEQPIALASASRRLSRVHRLQGSLSMSSQLLDEAIRTLRPLLDARDYLGQPQREMALARLERAELYFQQTELSRASSESKASLGMLDRTLDKEERSRSIRLNAASLAAQGRAAECLNTLMEVAGTELVPHLMGLYQPELVERAVPLLRDKHPDGAVKEAFIVLDEALKKRVGKDKQTTELAGSWFQETSRGLGEFDRPELEGFRQFAVGALAAGRNRVMHKRIDMTEIEAQCWIAAVNLILRYIDSPSSGGPQANG